MLFVHVVPCCTHSNTTSVFKPHLADIDMPLQTQDMDGRGISIIAAQSAKSTRGKGAKIMSPKLNLHQL